MRVSIARKLRGENIPSGFSQTLSRVPVLNQYVRPSGFRCSVCSTSVKSWERT